MTPLRLLLTALALLVLTGCSNSFWYRPPRVAGQVQPAPSYGGQPMQTPQPYAAAPSAPSWHTQPQPQAQPEKKPAAQPEPGGPLKCTSCGADIPDGFKFCGRCGKKVDEILAEMAAGGGDAAAAAPAAQPEAAPAAQPEAAPAAGADALGRIIMIQPDGSEGASVPISEEGVTVGRNSGAPFSEDYFLSPEHAGLKMEGGNLTLEDKGSLNGIYLRLIPEQEYDLEPGTTFRIGQEVVRFELLPDPAKNDDGTDVMGSPRKSAWGRLGLVVSKDVIGNAFLLEGDEILIGRERGHIIFPEDGYVSGLHVKIIRKDGGYKIVDVGSSNGSYLRVEGQSQVNSGDYVLMGQYLYKVEF